MRFGSPTPDAPAGSVRRPPILQGTLDGHGAAGQGRCQLHNGEQTNSIPLVSSAPPTRVASSRRAYMTFAVLLIGNAACGGKWHTGRQNGVCGHKFKFHLVGFLLSLGSFGQVMGGSRSQQPEALFALMLTLPTQVVVGHTPPVIEEEGKFHLPFLAHSRHGAPIIENPPISAVTVEMGG